MQTTYRPLPKTLIVQDESEKLTSTALIIPDDAKVNVSGIGTVLSAAEGSPVTVGQRILYRQYEAKLCDETGGTLILAVPFEAVLAEVDRTYEGSIIHRGHRSQGLDPLGSDVAMLNREREIRRRKNRSTL